MPYCKKVEAYLCLKGDFDPDEFTAISKIVPSSIAQKGEAGRYSKRLNFSKWVLSSGEITKGEVDLYDLTIYLLKPLQANIEKIANFINQKELNVTYQIAIQNFGVEGVLISGFGVDVQQVNLLSQVNSNIDIDFYE